MWTSYPSRFVDKKRKLTKKYSHGHQSVNENTSLIKDIGRSFLVSSFIPAALYLAVATLIFKDFSPSFLTRRIIQNDELYIGQWSIIILLTSWLGFTLYSGWHWTVSLYEGYLFPKQLSNFLSKQVRKNFKRRTWRIRKFKRLAEIENPTPEEIRERRKLEDQVLADYAKVEIDFPMGGNFLPTRLGNILRAAERYPFDRYQIESLNLFPRLVQVFPKDFQNNLEESNNKFIFLLNSSFLSYGIGLVAILVSFLRLPCYLFNPNLLAHGLLSGYGNFFCTRNDVPINFFQQGFTYLTEWKYFWIGVAFILLGRILYEITLTITREFSKIIRSGFDLYRYDLMRALSIPIPKEFENEKISWLKVSNFIIAGEDGISEITPEIKPPATPENHGEIQTQPVSLNVSGNLSVNNKKIQKKKKSN